MNDGVWKRAAHALAGAVALGGSVLAFVAVDPPTAASGAAVSHPLSLNPSVDFGSVTLGDITSRLETVTNNSASSVTVLGTTSSGANPQDFSAFPDLSCPFLEPPSFVINLPPGGSCNVDFFFFPGALGARSATLTFVDSLMNSLGSVDVFGTGAIGYYQVSSAGAVANFGDAGFYGDASSTPLNHPIVGIAQTGDDGGYWLVASDGGIFNYGDAGFFGSTGAISLNKPIVGMAPTLSAQGYWLVASDGGIFSYGDAAFYGSTGGLHLNQPIVGMASTPDGAGYWLVAADGGIFAYGDAAFFGSTGALHLNQPIVDMASTPDGKGYWLVAADGGVFSYGDAAFYGSTGAIHLNKPIVGAAPMPTGNGYWFTASDGGLFNFGDAPFEGAAASNPIGTVVGMATDGAPTLQAALGQPADRHSVRSGSGGGWGPVPADAHVERG
jgi:hypothetical protein